MPPAKKGLANCRIKKVVTNFRQALSHFKQALLYIKKQMIYINSNASNLKSIPMDISAQTANISQSWPSFKTRMLRSIP
ncbi:hypothetical protein [Sphingobacterium bambusae]|uniref:Uncharacterized protein n=1 Tax=Sphingobacterium bambusae TaxID=662858 RepID=A0ABW6BGB6_9SPHI|nr:hypothetical protein [Sphingobacterium bambusae]WPL49698.1 hypothetical protein SCB77_04435 [Sphingobacterium bambusae]